MTSSTAVHLVGVIHLKYCPALWHHVFDDPIPYLEIGEHVSFYGAWRLHVKSLQTPAIDGLVFGPNFSFDLRQIFDGARHLSESGTSTDWADSPQLQGSRITDNNIMTLVVGCWRLGLLYVLRNYRNYHFHDQHYPRGNIHIITRFKVFLRA